MKRRCLPLSEEDDGAASGRRRSPQRPKRSHTHAVQTVVCTSVTDGCTQQWTSGKDVIAPGIGGRAFTFITRHQLLDGTTIPSMTPVAVHTALRRLGLASLIPTVVMSPT
eukprot:COSAG02_NODE_29292_length_572_cov_0.911205_1_plen_109_part_10